MKQTFKGWTVGLTSGRGHKYFLGQHTTAEGVKYGDLHSTPLEEGVYDCLFASGEEALEFWKTCYWEYLIDKKKLTSIPVKIEISLDVSALGFDWNGVQTSSS